VANCYFNQVRASRCTATFMALPCGVSTIRTVLCIFQITVSRTGHHPNFLFGGTIQTHSKTLDNDAVSTPCYLLECIKTSSTCMRKADVWNLLLSCCSDVYCNIIGNSLFGSQGVCRQPRTGHHNRHNILSFVAV